MANPEIIEFDGRWKFLRRRRRVYLDHDDSSAVMELLTTKTITIIGRCSVRAHRSLLAWQLCVHKMPLVEWHKTISLVNICDYTFCCTVSLAR